MLDAFRVLRLAVDVGFRIALQGGLHLVDRAWDDEPEQERDHAGDHEIVDREPYAPWDAPPVERLDPGAHRRREDEREEQQRDHELQLPEGERRHHDPADDERRDRCPLRGIGHS